jgi:hypothetical protein
VTAANAIVELNDATKTILNDVVPARTACSRRATPIRGRMSEEDIQIGRE